MMTFDRETITMVASIAALVMALYVYRELQLMQAAPSPILDLPIVESPPVTIVAKENPPEKDIA
jgi:hypothetical protein